ncbi:MAG: glycerol-3-phosphate acyltransferase [Sporichthyaceae bacterium]|nr:glycerol-3-phosphate acyltransferase [Sporichthyaceae bacterium]
MSPTRLGIGTTARPPASAVLLGAYLLGSVPFAQLTARLLRDADLREQGTGTVSATGLGPLAGTGPLVVAGLLDSVKGGVGPILAGPRRRPTLAALAGGAAVAGHNWSPLLAGAGGRGLSPALGALTVTAPAGALILLGGVGLGRAGRQTALGALSSYLVLVPALHRIGGPAAARAGAAVLVPIVAKRLLGNQRAGTPTTYLWRLLYDRDQARRPEPAGRP